MHVVLASGLLAAGVWFSGAAAATAQGAPTQLRGKSIILTWTEHRMQRGEGRSDFKAVNVHQTLQIYVSGEGRVFERRTATATRAGAKRGAKRGRGMTGSDERVGGGAVAGAGASTRFQGRSLVLAGTTRQAGARHVSVEFDQGFSSCSVQVKFGRQEGAKLVKDRSLTGHSIEFEPQGTSGGSCTVRDGNVFAQ